jgi:hypothetical protein
VLPTRSPVTTSASMPSQGQGPLVHLQLQARRHTFLATERTQEEAQPRQHRRRGRPRGPVQPWVCHRTNGLGSRLVARGLPPLLVLPCLSAVRCMETRHGLRRPQRERRRRLSRDQSLLAPILAQDGFRLRLGSAMDIGPRRLHRRFLYRLHHHGM